jgi:hypothetical protein
MTKSEAEERFKELDRINGRVEDIREDFQWDGDLDKATATIIADHLGRACEAFGHAVWAIHAAYQLRDAEEILNPVSAG